MAVHNFTFKSDEDAGSGWPNIVRVESPSAGFGDALAALIAGDFMSETQELVGGLTIALNEGTDFWSRVVMKGASGGNNTQYLFDALTGNSVAGLDWSSFTTLHGLSLPFTYEVPSAIIVTARAL